MSFVLGGQVVEALSFTKSWGLSPASASVRTPGEAAVTAGDDIVLSIGSLIFNGVVSDDPVTEQDGKFTDVNLVDARLKLMWDWVHGYFNREVVKEDNPATPGIDRVKRYEHIYPNDWDKRKKTITAEPMSAADIVAKCLAANTVANSWTTVTHADMAKPVYDVDADRGMKLGSLLQAISEELGLLFTLDNLNTIRWARKGDGVIPDFPSNSTNRKVGDALSNNDTNITIIGDQNRIQDFNVELEADWNSKLQPFWLEPRWLDEVKTVFGPFEESLAGEAKKAAVARAVTLRQYVAKKDATYADYGMWGEVCRMEIPVWRYLQDIVWKAFRLPRSYMIAGIRRQDLEFNDKGMLAAMTVDPASGNMALKTPREFYPDSKAFVAVQGQPINLLDPRAIESIRLDAIEQARTRWQPVNEFNLDCKNCTVIFEHAVFVPGEGDGGVFLFPNKDLEDITEDDPLKYLAVPNADLELEVPRVKAAIVFDTTYYSKQVGSGVRKGPKFMRGLSYHAITNNGVFAEEVRYADGKTVEQKATTIGNALSAQQAIYKTGGYNRPGAAGTVLTGSVDRITVSVSFSAGLSERVDFTKEKTEPRFENERLLDRRGRSRDLFPGQKANADDVARIVTIYAASKELKRVVRPIYSHASDLANVAVGAVECAPTTVLLADATPAGRPIFVDGKGKVSKIGTTFKGVNIMEGATGSQVTLATQGVVPVRVKGPVAVGDRIGVNMGDDDARPNGGRAIGIANGSYSGTEIVVVPVRLATSLPAPEPWKVTFVDGDSPKALVYPSTINNMLPSNAGSSISMPESGKRLVVLTVETDGRQVTSCKLESATDSPSPPQCLNGAPPSTFKIPIWVMLDDGSQFQVHSKPLIAVMTLCRQLERSEIPAGASPWENWWTWSVGPEVIPPPDRLVG